MNLEDKRQLFEAFFTLPFEVKINLEQIEQNHAFDQQGLELEIPYPFKLASELNKIDNSNSYMNSNQQLPNDVSRILAIQNKKIDLMLSYLLMQEDQQKHRYSTTRFGAGGLTVKSNNNWLIGDKFKLKIFMPEEACAVYCFAEIIGVIDNESDKLYEIVYSVIRDEDREVLVRMALHQQSKQLRQLALERASQANENQ
ncbi:hypothetical protein DS2_04500 [Catenovulum agarivorans DS-2]|uniref:PilZ domain-containing protein n=1 Tax=Catenovulum agarivorans DS-2 TaxID=1328313 RepID=W7R1A4_9ALTE|nr:PilZ domain-containing protein [Catenovulum agarivorans]EWH11405.1 hypothetical protein DS2_04500 [Catenovulum agarivorans DS-2]